MTRATEEVYRELLAAARDRRRDGAFERAGDYYTLAAYWWLVDSEFRSDDAFGHALAKLLYAVAAYRLAGATRRSRNRAEQGVLLAEDARESVFDHDAFRGLANEYAGDFLVFGGLDGAEAAYERALDCYRTVESDLLPADVTGWANREPSYLTSKFVLDLAETVGVDVDEETTAEIRSRSLAKCVEYKRDDLAAFVERLVDEGAWPPVSDG